MKKALIISNNSGGGHRQTARILSQTLEQCGWVVEITSVYEELFSDYFDVFGVKGEAYYNKLVLTKEMTWLVYRIFFICAYYLILLPNRKKFAGRLAEFWQEKQPNLIISVIPLLNQTIADSLTKIPKPVPFVIVQTDLFEFHEEFWLTPTGTWFVSDDKTYTVVGTEEAYQQVVSTFISDESRVFKLSGNIVASRFLEKPTFNHADERKKLGLDPKKPIGLVMYGSFPPNRLLKTAKTLNKLGNQVQFIFICGKNERLQRRIGSLSTNYNKLVVGYTSEVSYYMHLSDFLIGKSGPGMIMEGVATGLPLLIDTRKVIIHEAKNVDWVERHGFGLQFNGMVQLIDRINHLSSSEMYHQLKMNVSKFENKAILEIPEVIERVMIHWESGFRNET